MTLSKLSRHRADIHKIRDHSLANEEGTPTYVVTQNSANRNEVVIWEEYLSDQAFEGKRSSTGDAYMP